MQQKNNDFTWKTCMDAIYGWLCNKLFWIHTKNLVSFCDICKAMFSFNVCIYICLHQFNICYDSDKTCALCIWINECTNPHILFYL